LSVSYDIAVRPGAHCAPLMHRALGTSEQGAVRFSFSWYNTEEEIDTAIRAVRELAEET
jgi:selenocysteine lyase/cysteine desulfurase